MEAEASSRIVVDGEVISTRCDQCRIAYSERNPPEDPPCHTCWVDPLPANRDALKIYNLVQDQFIMGFGGPVAINQNAIHRNMDLYEVKDKVRCFEKVLVLSNRRINEIAKKSKDE
jgi:hypothetical protein